MVDKDEVKGKATELRKMQRKDDSEELKGKTQQEFGKIKEKVKENSR